MRQHGARITTGVCMQVKSALRRVPSAAQRLVAAQAACRFQAGRAAAQVQQAGPAGAMGRQQQREALEERARWLRLADTQLAGVLGGMQAMGGSECYGAGAAGAVDRSPARDQDAAAAGHQRREPGVWAAP